MTHEFLNDLESKLSAEKICDALLAELPRIGSNLVRESTALSKHLKKLSKPDEIAIAEERARSFAEKPDDPKEHDTRWHEWGIVSHSRDFVRCLAEELPRFFGEWGFSEDLKAKMAETVGTRTRGELLTISAPIHDLGKFTARWLNVKRNEKGEIVIAQQQFDDHERESGENIRRPEFVAYLRGTFGLSDVEIEHVARLAEKHFELGLVRKAAIHSGQGFNFSFVRSPEFTAACDRIIAENPEIAPEIGFMFLADSLAKTSVRSKEVKSDQEMEDNLPEIEEELKRRGLPRELAGQVKQQSLNIEVARMYLERSLAAANS